MLFQNIFILLGFTLCVYASPLLNRGFNTTVSARQLSTGNDGSGTQNTGNVGQNPVSSSANLGIIDSGVTVGQALETCGAAQLNCCKKTPGGGDAASTGILGSVFGAGDVGILCTPLDVPVIGFQIPINQVCDAKAACCLESISGAGLVKVNCVGLDPLI